MHIIIHKCIHGMGFKKCTFWAPKEMQKLAVKEMGISDVCIDTRLNKAVWAKGIRNIHTISVHICSENIMKIMSHQTSSIH